MLKEYLIRKGLSRRESEVASLVAEGLANRKIAERLFVTEKTVKFHLTNIYRKMKLKSRAQLIVFCLPGISFVETQSANIQNAQTNRSAFGATDSESTLPSGQSTLPHSNGNTNNGNSGVA